MYEDQQTHVSTHLEEGKATALSSRVSDHFRSSVVVVVFASLKGFWSYFPLTRATKS